MEDEYTKTVRKFSSIYESLKKKYNLRMSSSFSIYQDGLIEIWEYDNGRKKKCICRAKEKEDIDCYKMAISNLEYFKKEKEEAEHERSAAMAV